MRCHLRFVAGVAVAATVFNSTTLSFPMWTIVQSARSVGIYNSCFYIPSSVSVVAAWLLKSPDHMR